MVGGRRVENVEDVLSVGQKVQVEISAIDPRGKLSLIPVLADESKTDSEKTDAAAEPAEANA
jgi:polyribonucleotide nucleotidyltransferase